MLLSNIIFIQYKNYIVNYVITPLKISKMSHILLKVCCNIVIDLTPLFPFFPEEMVRNIASYLVMKIPANDSRYQLLESHYCHNKKYRVHERLSPNLKNYFSYNITFSNPKYILSIIVYYNDFILYQFKNTVTEELHADRCWFNLEDMHWRRVSTNYWQQFFIDGWLPNPNTTIL
jgi:hypothetical protein